MTNQTDNQVKPEARTESDSDGSLHGVVMPPLVIPMGDDKYAVIPLGISLDDFKRLQKTLKLWKKRIVLPVMGNPITEKEA